MKHLLTGLAALTISTVAAQAGGIDRVNLPIAHLFDEGNVARLSFSSVTPSVTGAYASPLSAFGASTGNMAQSYTSLGFALKMDMNDRLSAALMLNPSYGADAKYTGGAYTGLEAHWSTSELAAVLRYKLNDQVSVYGGLRNVTSEANILIPAALLGGTPYTATASSDTKLGYLVGAAYEKPEIALRAALTYQSAIDHDFATAEQFGTGSVTNSTTNITLPQSVTLDFQTGIAANTLLFGSVKWAEWSKWQVRPIAYATATGDRVTGFDNDVVTYQIGLGRKINDNLSVFARMGYEASTGDEASRLAPTDGMQSLGLGGTWTQGNMKITGGVEYVQLGDALDGSNTDFSGNSAVGVGMLIEFNF